MTRLGPFLNAMMVGCALVPAAPSLAGNRDYWPTDDWRSRAPEEACIDASALRALRDDIAAGAWGDVHSLLIVKDGYLVAEDYFPGSGRDDVHEMQSVTKSVASVLMGIAMEQGRFTESTRVVSLFPERTFADMGGPPGGTPTTVRTSSVGYQGFSMSFDLDPAASILLLAVQVTGTDGTGAPGSSVWLDELSLTFDDAPGVDVLGNGDFESGDVDEPWSTFPLNTNIGRWTGQSAGCTTGLSASTALTAAGAHAARLEPIGWCADDGDSTTWIVGDLSAIHARGATRGTFAGEISVDRLALGHEARILVVGLTSTFASTTIAEARNFSGTGTLVPGDAPSKAEIEIGHLLDMRHGLLWREWGYTLPTEQDQVVMLEGAVPVGDVFQCPTDWLQYVMDRPMASAPGTTYQYSTGVSALFSAVLDATTSLGSESFADEHLFDPLGVTSDHWWVIDANGVLHAGGALRLTARDLARFGLLLASDGAWNGRQVVPSAYLERARTPTTRHVSMGLHYSAQFWLVPVELPDGTATLAMAALGRGGQACLVVPELDLVLVSTADNPTEPNQTASVTWLRDVVLPAISDLPRPATVGPALRVAGGREPGSPTVTADLDWSGDAGAPRTDGEHYRVLCGTSASRLEPCAVDDVSTTSWSHVSLAAEALHFFRVLAANACERLECP
ncbi:MAG: serine hydrolase [Acidobacteriota bacterium]